MASHSTEDSTVPSMKDIQSLVGNMVIAHEMIVNDQFELKAVPENTLEKKIQEIVRKAFWDNIQEQLSQDPPSYESALQLLHEIKDGLFSVVLAHHKDVLEEIEENLSFDHIKQEVVNGCFDLHSVATFLVSVMLKICAPARDNEVKAILERDGVVPILRGIMETLDHLKLDMANTQLKTIKPYLILQSTEYERNKFKEYLSAHPDGLRLTKEWLSGAFQRIEALIQAKARASPEKDGQTVKSVSSKISPSIVVTEGYLELLKWKENRFYPETLLMDEVRLTEISQCLEVLLLVSATILVTTSTVGSRLSADTEYMASLKSSLTLLMQGVPKSKLTEVMSTSVYEQVAKETNTFLVRRGFDSTTDEQRKLLAGQIADVVTESNHVRTLLESRLRDFVMISIGTDQKIGLPTVFMLFEEEIRSMVGRFVRLVNHNRRVFEPIYFELVEEIKQTKSTCENNSTT